LTAAACAGGSDSSPNNTTPPGLHINEVMPANAATCADEVGQYDDWIEIHNSGGADIALKGLSVSDDPDVPFKRVLGEGLVVPAGGFLILWADDDTSQGENHLPFKLSAAGEQVLLYGRDGGLVDQVAWTDAISDVSFARLPDGAGGFAVCGSPTCGTANGGACTSRVDAGGP